MVNPAKKPRVTKEEEKFRNKNYSDVHKVINKNPLCTSCNSSVKSMVINGKPLLHPFLDTLLCEKCSSFYGDGEFSVDEDGSDKYCRWCGQGGTLFLCSDCTAGFCKKCIKRNLSRSVLKDVESNDWECFCCKVEPLYDLRAQAWAAQQHSKSVTQQKKGKKSRVSDSDDDLDLASRKRASKSKKPPALTVEEKACKLAISNHKTMLGDLVSICNTVEKKVNEINTKKLSRRVTLPLTVAEVENLQEKFISIYDHFISSMEKMKRKFDQFNENWKEALETAKEDAAKESVKNGDTKTKKSIAKNSDESEDREDISSGKSDKRKNSKSRSKNNDEDSSDGETNDAENSEDEDVSTGKSSKRKIAKSNDEENSEDEDVSSGKSSKRKIAKSNDEENSEDEDVSTGMSSKRKRTSSKVSEDETSDGETTKSKDRSTHSKNKSRNDSDSETDKKSKSKCVSDDSDEDSVGPQRQDKRKKCDSDNDSNDENRSIKKNKKSKDETNRTHKRGRDCDEILGELRKSMESISDSDAEDKSKETDEIQD